MRELILIIITIVAFVSCQKSKEKISQSILDNSDMKIIKKHTYKYDLNGKIIVDELNEFTLLNDQKIDSVKIICQYSYDSIERLIKKINTIKASNDEFKDGYQVLYPHKTVYQYNLMDSVIAEYNISESGNTLFSIETQYGENLKVARQIVRYDTVQSITEYIYKNELIDKTINIYNGVRENESQYIYEDTILTKIIEYSDLLGTQYIHTTSEFTYNDPEKPKILKVDNSGTILYFLKTITLNNHKIDISYSDGSTIDSIFYNDIGQVELRKEYDIQSELIEIVTYKYDNRGNIIEETINRRN